MSSQRERGFTLLELMMVVALMGAILAMTIPGITSLVRSSRVTGAANTLAADFHYGRMLANQRKQTFVVLFAGGGYRMFRPSTSDTILKRNLPSGMTCSATDTATFYAWGLTDPVTVTLTESGHTSVLRLAANGSVSHE
jgi:prepilin-type N-terminal cleavage/methylation domain-containing protein